MVVRGVAKIFIYNEESGELNEIVSASGNLQVICVPRLLSLLRKIGYMITPIQMRSVDLGMILL